MGAHRAVVWVSLALVFGIVAACGRDESGSKGSAVDAGSDAPTFGDGPCAACVDGACAASRSACTGEPSCAAWLACRAACPLSTQGNVDPSCASGCALPSGSEGAALYDAFSSCAAGAAQSCTTCGGTDAGGGDADAGGCKLPTQACEPSSLADPCSKCTKERCCDSAAAVGKSSGIGFALVTCLTDCSNQQACYDDCFVKHPEGVPAWGEYMACYQASCDPEFGCSTTAGDCDHCVFRECGCEYSACFKQAECFLAWRCLQKCTPTDTACTQACLEQHPEAKAGMDAYGTCIVSRCLAFCGQ